MNINSAFPSKYLKASDLGTAQPIVEINSVTIEEVGQDREKRPVVYFTGKQKGLVLNKTNARSIAQITGYSETDQWPGAKVKLYATETEMQGERMECIRIKSPTPAGQPPQAVTRTPPKPVAAPVEADVSYDNMADPADTSAAADESVPF